MVTPKGWLLSGTVMALLACDAARAEGPVEVATNSAAIIQFASSQSVVRSGASVFLIESSTSARTVTAVSESAASINPVPAINAIPAAVRATVARTTNPQDAQQPALSPTSPAVQSQLRASAPATQLSASIFGAGAAPTSQLAQERRARASGVSSDVVSGSESNIRASTDAGSLLSKSSQARGVSTQQRTPIITDTRVRGAGVGRLVASGG